MTKEQGIILVDTVQQLSLAHTLEDITNIVRSAARQLTGADGATFVLKDGQLCYYADEDAIAPLWKGQRFSMDTCISGWAMLNKQAAVIKDIYADNRIPHDAYRPTFVKSLVMVPIRSAEPVGAIGNYWAEYHEPTQHEIWMLQSLANITSVSIEKVYVNNELEERVKLRTKELEIANAELEGFAYSVSHDLRAPLRAITSRLDFLEAHYRNKEPDETSMKLILSMKGITAEMRQLIESLLNFAKMVKLDLTMEELEMNSMVEEICAQVREQEKERQIKIEVMQLPKCLGDRMLVKQVWINIISNAIKYCGHKNETEIFIGSEDSDKGPAYFVKDNGAGFDMAYSNKLFGVFQRLHHQDEFAGTGIGLALVQRILNRHGGTIWATGKKDEGAQFYFTLPLCVSGN